MALALFSFVVTVTAKTVADPDLWGHLRFGLDTLESRGVIQVDPYSYLTQGQRWINHEWLAEVLFAIGWKFAGVAGLVWLKTATFLGLFLVVYLQLRSRGAPPLRAAILIVVLMIVLLPFLAALRPYVFTALFFAVVLHVIARAERGQYGWLWVVPPVLGIWVNLHGAFIAGLGIYVVWTALHLVFNPRSFRQIAPPLLCSFAAVFMNPYRQELLFFLARTATVPRPEITDWQPMAWNSVLGLLDLSLLAAGFAGLLFTRKRRNPVLLVLFSATALMPFFAVRHILLSAIGTVMLLGEHISDALGRVSTHAGGSFKPREWFSAVPLLLALLFPVGRIDSFRRISLPDDFYPVRAVAVLKESGVRGNIALHFSWGEYAIWHLGPGWKVSVDGRRETVYPPESYREALQFQFGLDDWDALLTDHPTDLALVPAKSRIYDLMSSRSGWSNAFQDSISAIFVRNADMITVIRRSTGKAADGSCFP